MEQNNQRNSKKKLNSLILLVAFTAVMLIVSTYAWFSTQKNVTLSNIYGKVNVAEGLQISLDGSVWVNSIDFADFDQTTTSWTLKEGVEQSTYFDAATDSPSFQYPAGQAAEGGDTLITNVIPTEFLPVSTTGYSNDGIGKNSIVMYGGNVENNKQLTSIDDVPEDAAGGYFAFDLFVWNSSAEGATFDVLQLDNSSSVSPDNSGTGIENTVRVGFALYNNAGDEVSTTETRSQGDVIGGTSTGYAVKDFAIWEPNANKHTATIVNTNNALTISSADQTEFGLVGAGKYSVTGKYEASDALPTYALTNASLDSTFTSGDSTVDGIGDIYNWTDTATTVSGLKRQYTLQTTDSTFTEGTTSVPLISSGKKSGEIEPTETGDTTFTLAASQYHKIRVYIWIEGQDPDCINQASLGGGLTVNIGFSKPGSEEAGS